VPDDIVINPALVIPASELSYRASRSGGPGGQHVNTSSTRIELVWNVAGSLSLSGDQRQRLLTRLATRLDSSGGLRLVSSGTRSQLQNREEVTERFRLLIGKALIVPKKRKKTRPSRAAKERRLQSKKHRSGVKVLRGRVRSDE
jgi:ribosome-associated protein